MSLIDQSKPLKLGMVGLSATGWAATVLGPTVTQPSMREHFDLVAVSTSNETSAKASAEKQAKVVGHPVKAYYGDTSRISGDSDVDHVAVAVKAIYHKASVMPAIEAKKSFFVEWPAGTGLQDSVDMAEAARRDGVKSIVGLQGRQSKVFTKVCYNFYISSTHTNV